MFGLHYKTLLPAIIFALCILELSFGVMIAFHVVWWSYFYIALNANVLLKTPSTNFPYKLDRGILVLYFLNVGLFVLHHFSSTMLFNTTTAESFNILWWTTFALILVRQIQLGSVIYVLFWKYLSALVFAGAVLSSLMGYVKYFNILVGNTLPRYYYNDVLIQGTSLNTDYNVFSLGLIIAVLLSTNLRIHFSSTFFKTLYGLFTVMILGSILLSGSRRAVLMVVGVVLIMLFNTRLQRLKSQRTLLQILIIPVFGVLLLGQYFERIVAYLEDSEYIDQGISRVFTLKEQLTGKNDRTIRFDWALEQITDASIGELLFGQGFQYISEMGKLFSQEAEDHPHNFVLATLIYAGLIGGIVVILLIYRALSLAFYQSKNMYFIFLFIVLFGLTSSNTLFSYRIFPVVLFLLAIRPLQTVARNQNLSNLSVN